MSFAATVPGVYFEPRSREPEAPFVRTDVAGFVGLEPRLRDGTTPSQLTGGPPPVGHRFQLDVTSFELDVRGVRWQVPAQRDLPLSAHPAAIPMASGEGVVYALAAALAADGTVRLVVAAGLAGTVPAPPADALVAAAVIAALGGERPWQRLADVRVTRAGDTVRLTVIPRLEPTRCDDWRDYLHAFGPPPADGTLLGPAVRAFFANGGSRCWVATVERPDFDDPAGMSAVLAAMVGLRGASQRQATGLERLLLIDEVSVLDAPDLYAQRQVVATTVLPLPASEEEARFRCCRGFLAAGGAAAARGERLVGDPLFTDAEVLAAQVRMLRRVIDERWRALLLLAVPLELDPASGLFRAPTAPKAQLWRGHFAALGEAPEAMSCAALYHPWLLAQERVDDAVTEMPPTPFAAGVIARRDLARGPHVAPANETLRGVVGLARPIDEALHGELYAPPGNINILRPFPGYGIQAWGARTLSTDVWLRYLPVRRCLSAIERRVVAALQELVFEPHTAFLWLQASQQVLHVLLDVFASGALRGERAEEAFYVRCDSAVNPPEQVEAGLLVCEVGVAIAAPAEFIVFRVGRREGITEVME